VKGVDCMVQNVGCRVQSAGCRPSHGRSLGFKILGKPDRGQLPRMEGLRFRVQDLRLRVQGLRFAADRAVEDSLGFGN